MLIGYARVSTDDQENLDLQRDACGRGGTTRITETGMSGAKAARPGLAQAMEMARAKDVLTVWRLDRLGRSLHDLIVLARTLEDAGIGLIILQEKIDIDLSDVRGASRPTIRNSWTSQRDALRAAGCQRIYEDRMSGVRRPGLVWRKPWRWRARKTCWPYGGLIVWVGSYITSLSGPARSDDPRDRAYRPPGEDRIQFGVEAS